MSTGMYTTKTQNAKKANSYVSLGSPYNVKKAIPPRAKGKQFLVANLKPNQGNFGANTYTGSQYDIGTTYLNKQPLDKRKLGFGSHDAKRRDEFSNQAKQSQYKEKIRAEEKFLDSCLKKEIEAGTVKETDPNAPTAADIQASKQQWFQANVPSFLYDIGNSDEGITPLCNKCSRETFLCKHRVQKDLNRSPKRLGGDSMSSSSYGSFMKPRTSKAAYGRKMEKELGTFKQRESLTPTAKQLRTGLQAGPLNSEEFFVASPYGRKHTMREFKDNLHLSVKVKS